MSSQRHATVVGLGSVLPERIVSNEWFESFIETSDEWIRERTGIRERHYALDGQTTSDLATDATRRASPSERERGASAESPTCGRPLLYRATWTRSVSDLTRISPSAASTPSVA